MSGKNRKIFLSQLLTLISEKKCFILAEDKKYYCAGKTILFIGVIDVLR